nr:TetR/AcrR family transcriptional regulator [uncultured Catonella sp.]
MKAKSTKEQILESGKRMFLKKGFKSAPLRTIVKEAGFTLGAFYGYYKTKEELFYALTNEAAEGLKRIIDSMNEEIKELPAERMIFDIMEYYNRKLPDIADYIYLHKEEMILLIKCSAGTRYEEYFASLGEENKKLINLGVEKAKSAGIMIQMLETDTFELLMRSYSEMIAKIIIEGRDREQVFRMMKDVGAFFRNGMLSLMEEKRN